MFAVPDVPVVTADLPDLSAVDGTTFRVGVGVQEIRGGVEKVQR